MLACWKSCLLAWVKRAKPHIRCSVYTMFWCRDVGFAKWSLGVLFLVVREWLESFTIILWNWLLGWVKWAQPHSVPPGFSNSAIAEFIAKSSKLRNFRKGSQIFIIAADFGFRRVPWRHCNTHCQRKVVSQFEKWNEQLAFSACPIYKSYIGWTNPCYSFELQTVYLLGPEPRAALHHATSLHTALGDTVKKVA